jgi:hypothetical protein
MYDQKPTTTLAEDFEVLGLLSDGQRAAIKAKEAKRRLSENADPMAPAPSPAPPMPGEPDGDEVPDAPGAGAPPAAGGAPAPGAPPAPAPAPPPHPGHDKPEGYDDEMAAYEQAWTVVRQFHSLSEAEVKSKFTHEDYRYVLNAQSFIIETQNKYMGSDLMDKDPSELPGNGPAGYKWAGKPENDPSDQITGTNAPRVPKGYKWGKASPRPGEKAEAVENTLKELKGIIEGRTSAPTEDEMQELGTKIIEGYEHIRDVAGGFVEHFTNELKGVKEAVDAKDPRVKLGKYFESIHRNAATILDGIAKNEQTDVDDAIEDLQSLTRDLKKGLAAMEG